MIEYRTPACIVCGEHSVMLVDSDRLDAWRRGTLIQEAFPHHPAEVREQLKTGTHSACWDSMFGEEDE